MFQYILTKVVALLQILIPPPPSFNNPNTTQPPTSHSPHQYNTPSNTPPPTKSFITQPSISRINKTLPPIPLSFTSVITTQPQSLPSQKCFPTALSFSYPNPPSFFCSISKSSVTPTTYYFKSSSYIL